MTLAFGVEKVETNLTVYSKLSLPQVVSSADTIAVLLLFGKAGVAIGAQLASTFHRLIEKLPGMSLHEPDNGVQPTSVDDLRVVCLPLERHEKYVQMELSHHGVRRSAQHGGIFRLALVRHLIFSWSLRQLT